MPVAELRLPVKPAEVHWLWAVLKRAETRLGTVQFTSGVAVAVFVGVAVRVAVAVAGVVLVGVAVAAAGSTVISAVQIRLVPAAYDWKPIVKLPLPVHEERVPVKPEAETGKPPPKRRRLRLKVGL